MIDRLAVVLHCDLHVRLDEIPGLREISVSDAVPFPDRAALCDVHLIEEVHLLQLVDVAIDRRLRRLQLRGELLDRPTLDEAAEQAFDEQPVRDRSPRARSSRTSALMPMLSEAMCPVTTRFFEPSRPKSSHNRRRAPASMWI